MNHDHGSSDDVTITDNNAFLMAMGEGSRIEIHAADAAKEAWSQLDATAEAGDTQITLDEDTGWEVGDRIAIASSGYDHDSAEEFTITAIDIIDGKSVITLDAPIENYHHGEMQTYDNGLTGADYQEWELDERAEVALLSRNVTIQGDEDSSIDQYGGHTMVMHDADMHISGAAFENMGQAGELGRYPIHAHMLGDSSEGMYVSDVSVVNSFNKGITIHDSNNMWFEDNVVYNTIGHGFYFEDGSETGNVLKGNLAFDQNAAPDDNATIPTDATHASSYWVTNPNNHFLDNHAAGADHSGFFFTYEDEVNGQAGATGEYDGYTPAEEVFGLFKGNAAHSNKHNLWHAGDTAEDGTFDTNSFTRDVNEDGNLYAPLIEDFTSYRAWERAIFNKDVGGVYDDIKSAGNNSDFFVNGQSVVQNSLSVGLSDNPGDIEWEAEIEAGTELPPGTGFNGYSWYDGGQLIRDSHFTGFTGEDDTAFSLKFGNMMGGGNALEGITFGDDTTGANQYSHGSYWDGADGTAADEIALQVVDIDGSLTGIPGATLTSALSQMGEESFGFQAAPGAVYSEDWNVWINGPEHDIGHLKLWDSEDAPFDLERSDGLKVTLNDNDNASEVLIVANTDLSYVIRDAQNLDRDIVNLRFGDLQEGSQFYLAFEDVSDDAVLNGATEVADKAEADAYEGTAYYWDGGTIHVKIYADSRYNEQIKDEAAAGDETVYWEDTFQIDVTGEGGLTPRDNYTYDWGEEKWEIEAVVAEVDQDPEQPASTSNTVELDGSEKRWSDSETWNGHVPGADDIIVIEAGERVLLDQDVTVKGIVVKGGELVVEDVKDLELASDWILVIEGGLFQVGTEDNPHVHNFTLTLEGDDPDADLSLAAIMADPDTLFAVTPEEVPVEDNSGHNHAASEDTATDETTEDHGNHEDVSTEDTTAASSDDHSSHDAGSHEGGHEDVSDTGNAASEKSPADDTPHSDTAPDNAAEDDGHTTDAASDGASDAHGGHAAHVEEPAAVESAPSDEVIQDTGGMAMDEESTSHDSHDLPEEAPVETAPSEAPVVETPVVEDASTSVPDPEGVIVETPSNVATDTITPPDPVAETPVQPAPVDVAPVEDPADTPTEAPVEDAPEEDPLDILEGLADDPTALTPEDLLDTISGLVEPEVLEEIPLPALPEEEDENFFDSILSFFTSLFDALFGGDDDDDDAPAAVASSPQPETGIMLSDILPVTGNMDEEEDVDANDTEDADVFA